MNAPTISSMAPDAAHPVQEHARSGAEGFPFQAVLRRDDRIFFGQGCSEPVGLLRELLLQGDRLHATHGKLELFVGGSCSGLLRPEHDAWFDFSSYGAIGDAAALARAGRLQVHPVHYAHTTRSGHRPGR